MADYVKKCPECGGVNMSWNKDKGEVSCRDCGLVLEDKMVDFGQEWREFGSDGGDEKRRRGGAPLTYTQYDQGLGTEVGRKGDLIKLEARSRNKFFRLRKWQYRISTAIERNLKLALGWCVEYHHLVFARHVFGKFTKHRKRNGEIFEIYG